MTVTCVGMTPGSLSSPGCGLSLALGDEEVSVGTGAGSLVAGVVGAVVVGAADDGIVLGTDFADADGAVVTCERRGLCDSAGAAPIPSVTFGCGFDPRSETIVVVTSRDCVGVGLESKERSHVMAFRNASAGTIRTHSSQRLVLPMFLLAHLSKVMNKTTLPKLLGVERAFILYNYYVKKSMFLCFFEYTMYIWTKSWLPN